MEKEDRPRHLEDYFTCNQDVKYKINPEELEEDSLPTPECLNLEQVPHFELADLEKTLKRSVDTLVGVKHNKHKLPMSKLFKQFPRALQAIVLASCYGHNKYNKNGEDQDWMNYSRVSDGSEGYADAGIRHILDNEIYGQEDESGLPHIFHQLWDKMAECELWIKENDIDIKEMATEYLKNLK